MKNRIKEWLFLIYILLSTLLVIIFSIYFKAYYLSVIASILGIFYTFFIAKQKRIGCLFGILNVLILGYILFKNEVYFSSFYNIFYSFPLLIYGYLSWGKNNKINNFSKKGKLFFITIITSVFLIGLIIYFLTSDILRFLDILTSSFGFIGMFLLAKKYSEQWFIWIISNTANFILWIVLTMQDISNIVVLTMWSVYLINSIIGFLTWKVKK